jgi:hypothetical protein
MLVLASLAMAAATPPQSAACKRLADEFRQNEIAYSMVRQADESSVAASQSFGESTGDYSKAEQAREALRRTDSTFKAEGDRIFNVMMGLKCELPDHVTSYLTYRGQLQKPKAPVANQKPAYF